jgi:hypothetical protein
MKLLIALLVLSLAAHAQLPVDETELNFPDGSVYRGKLKDGKPDGIGFIRFRNGNEYQGSFKDGALEGHGISTSQFGDKYEGQWKNSQRNGFGKMSFRIGGAYEGEWKDDRFHGKGTIIYLGSGRRHETHFSEGVEEGAAVNIAAEQRVVNYRLKEDAETPNSRLLVHSAYYPQNKSFGDMTDEEKFSVRRPYGIALAKADEPPFPIDGMKQIGIQIDMAINRLKVVGKLGVIVNVLPDGTAASVNIIMSPNEVLTTYAERIFMQQKFKPGKCDGKPCAMPYVYAISIDRGR